MRDFVAEHVRLDVKTPGRDAQLMKLLGDAMMVFAR